MKEPLCRPRLSITAMRRRKPPWTVLLGERVDLGLNRLGDLRVEHAARVPANIANDDSGKDDEDQEIGRRELEGRGARHAAEPGKPAALVSSGRGARRHASAAGIADHVARSANGMQQGGLPLALDLAAQAGHMDINHVGLRVEMVIPHVFPAASCASPPARHGA